MTPEATEPAHAPMRYTVCIREVATGKTVEYHDSMPWDTEEDQAGNETHIEFMWSEGNYSCDCNRSLYFHRVLGLPEPEEVRCGHRLYQVDWIKIDATGKEIYTEAL